MSAPSLQLDGTLWLRSGDQPWGGQHRIDLLAQIEATGSISAAARAAGMSYKGAWDAIDAMNNLAGEPLVLRSAGGRGGGGTRLTDRARRLIATFRALQAEHQRFVQHLAASGLDAAGDIDIMRRFMLKTSARNRLLGTVEAVHAGAVNDEIVLRIAGGQRIAAVITRASTEELGLAPGTQAIALIKAQAVLLGLPGRACACPRATSCPARWPRCGRAPSTARSSSTSTAAARWRPSSPRKARATWRWPPACRSAPCSTPPA